MKTRDPEDGLGVRVDFLHGGGTPGETDRKGETVDGRTCQTMDVGPESKTR